MEQTKPLRSKDLPNWDKLAVKILQHLDALEGWAEHPSEEQKQKLVSSILYESLQKYFLEDRSDA